jgi:hypothetical protein
MRTVLLLGLLLLGFASGGCANRESRHIGAAGATGSGPGMTDTGGGTMNNPMGIEGAAGAAGATAGANTPSPEPRSTNVVTPPGTGSVSSTAGPEGGITGGGAGAATPANPHGTGTGPTTP